MLISRLVIIGIVLASARVAAATQTLAESLEYRVLDAEIIVLGSMRPADGSSQPGQVSVSVLEAFKGSAPAQLLVLYMPEPGSAPVMRVPPPTPADRQDLIFLERVHVAQAGVAPVTPELKIKSYVRLDESSGVYTSDLTFLTDTDGIIAATRQAIAFGDPAALKPALLSFPPQAPGTTFEPRPDYLMVPADARLESLGRKWANARDLQARVRAARALSSFHSPENVEVLKGLLADTAMPYSTGTGKWKRGVYAVREQAFTTLARWGEEVETPELEGPMYQYRPAYLDWLLFVPIALMGWLMLGVVVQGNRFRLGRAVLGGLTFASTLAAALFVVLWVRSWFIVDELMYPVRSDYHQVASYRGGVHYLVMADAEMTGGPLHGQFELSNVEDQWGLEQHTPVERWERAGFGFAVGRMTGPKQAAHPYRVVRVPYYVLFITAAALPAMGLSNWFRGWRRVTRGQCRKCGYDLRASRGRCPECGEREPVLV